MEWQRYLFFLAPWAFVGLAVGWWLPLPETKALPSGDSLEKGAKTVSGTYSARKQSGVISGDSPADLVASARQAMDDADIKGLMDVLKNLAVVDSKALIRLLREAYHHPKLRDDFGFADLKPLIPFVADTEGMLVEFEQNAGRFETGIAELVYGGLARAAPDKAWAKLMSSPYKADPSVIETVGKMWARVDPRAALEAVRKEPTTLANSNLIRSVTGEWGRTALMDFLQWLKQEPDRGRWADDIAWTAMQPQNAAEFSAWLQSLPAQLFDPYGEGFHGWDYFFRATNHSEDMPSWLQSLPKGSMRAAAVRAYAEHLLEVQPDAALAWREEIPDAAMRRRITSTAAAWRTLESPWEGLKIAESLTYPETRQAARQSVIDTWATFDLPAALNQALAHPEWNIDLGEIMSEWAADAPSEATMFAFNRNLGEQRREALQAWVRQDGNAASSWVASLPAGPAREDAVAFMAQAAMRTDPGSALSWALTLQDPARRKRLVDSSFSDWAKQRATKAADWLQTAALDTDVRLRLQAFLPNSIAP
jgi:hypothetical protein